MPIDEQIDLRDDLFDRFLQIADDIHVQLCKIEAHAEPPRGDEPSILLSREREFFETKIRFDAVDTAIERRFDSVEKGEEAGWTV